MKLPLPVNIVTGSLGSGKTTAIASLLQRKPQQEHWVVVVNEFGALGIDAALLEACTIPSGSQLGEQAAPPGSFTTPPKQGGNITIKELAGGCMCCTLSGPFVATIAQTIRRTKPDRLLIEPSGLGHPGKLIDALQGEHLRSAVDLQSVICLVDTTQFPYGIYNSALAAGGDDERPLVLHQIDCADVIVGSKADMANLEAQEAFVAWAAELYPPKEQVVLASHGYMDLSLLDLTACRSATLDDQAHTPSTSGLAAEGCQSNSAQNADAATEALAGIAKLRVGPKLQLGNLLLQPNKPLRKEYANGSACACGWTFAPEDAFNKERLQRFLADVTPVVQRVKGVFHVRGGWVAPVGSTAALEPISYRRDSRVEVIALPKDADGVRSVSAGSPAAAAATGDWDALEVHLLGLLQH